MQQDRLSGLGRGLKLGRWERFLAEMDWVVPWSRFEALIVPHCPVAGRGRRPYPLGAMLRIHFMQQWFGLSDPMVPRASQSNETDHRGRITKRVNKLAAHVADPAQPVFVMQTDAATLYEQFDAVIAQLKQSGVTKLGFVGNEAFRSF